MFVLAATLYNLKDSCPSFKGHTARTPIHMTLILRGCSPVHQPEIYIADVIDEQTTGMHETGQTPCNNRPGLRNHGWQIPLRLMIYILHDPQ